MDKIRSPLFSKSPDSLYVCGKFLQKGNPIIVSESLITEREKSLSERGVIKIRTAGKGKVQLLRK